jgi:hypothetical protein
LKERINEGHKETKKKQVRNKERKKTITQNDNQKTKKQR